MKLLLLGLGLGVVVAAGCSPAGSPSSADCSAQIRVADVVYTSHGSTSRDATRHGRADEAQCHDIGPDAGGSVFADDPEQVRTWTFEGYSPDEVLGVKYGTNGFGVFVADTVQPDQRERIYAELSGE
ncbi:DUF6281 family protein [Nocardioides marmotae]|uniref:DUF6281 family protein n=1 Tax=Nocardioides marmotae TaxID=2663857 RepID=UPI0012B61874|nr:DUF6281 family protein [Nocardioides marmotae]MBC9732419.1 hypothetical protein [Nocardioides marmotae]MTB83539.1 hypothetical protein [Nocardioides marmotae]